MHDDDDTVFGKLVYLFRNSALVAVLPPHRGFRFASRERETERERERIILS